MIGLKKTEAAGQTAVTGHTRHLGYEREQWGTNGSLGYGIRIHLSFQSESITFELILNFKLFLLLFGFKIITEPVSIKI